MYGSTYFIDKTSNTFADNLAAFGLAFVLNGVANSRAKIRLEDRGYAFAIVCEPAIQPEWVEQCAYFAGAPFLLTWDNGTQKKVIKGTALTVADLEASGDPVVDYQHEKENNATYFGWLKSLSSEDRRKFMRGEQDATQRPPSMPHADWDIFRAINPAALQGYNSLVAEWRRGRDAFPELLAIVLQMTAATPNALEEAETAWARFCKEHGWKAKPVTAIQLLNPTQGKGINNAKSTFSSPGNLKGFWLLEWLKMVGLFYGGITRIVANPKDPRNAKDRKTYVLMPLNLEWTRHWEVMKDFRQAMLGSATAVKLDIYVTLRYTLALLQYDERARPTDFITALFNERPSDLVSGMQTAYYKSLGSAIATLNIAVLNLPRWVAPRSSEQLAQLKEALQEHLNIIFRLDETRGDQFELLNCYRDFLSANDLNPFFAFTTAYSGFLISQRERRKPARQFTTTTLEVLFMNSDDNRHTYSTIVQNEGFRNIAYAIRRSTVVPQTRKGQGGKLAVDIRYGLGQQLARKAAYPGEFLAEISGFLHLYNAENAQLREKKRNPFRKDVTVADIEALAGLVDEFGSKVVCNMLVAYGYAREPHEPTPVDDMPGSDLGLTGLEVDNGAATDDDGAEE